MAELRLRTDDWRDAGKWRAVLLGAAPDPRQHPETRWAAGWPEWLESHEEAKPGDVWPIKESPDGLTPSRRGQFIITSSRPDLDWPVTHYALVCPVLSCPDGVHAWHHAYDCEAGDTFGAACKRGPGRHSCWDWSGSIEGGNLTAAPSLQVLLSDPPGRTCAYHGFLREGVMTNA